MSLSPCPACNGTRSLNYPDELFVSTTPDRECPFCRTPSVRLVVNWYRRDRKTWWYADINGKCRSAAVWWDSERQEWWYTVDGEIAAGSRPELADAQKAAIDLWCWMRVRQAVEVLRDSIGVRISVAENVVCGRCGSGSRWLELKPPYKQASCTCGYVGPTRSTS